MKKIIVTGCIMLLLSGCNNRSSSSSKQNDSASSASAAPDNIEYAYMPAHHPADNWDRGDQKNVSLVLNSYKAYENGKIDECLNYFADSVDIAWDHYVGKVSKDTLRAWLTTDLKQRTNLRIVMDDFEAVVSKDKKNNWVSLWYKEIWTNKNGKTDSVYEMDDLKIENSKISILDEKIRHFPAAKK